MKRGLLAEAFSKTGSRNIRLALSLLFIVLATVIVMTVFSAVKVFLIPGITVWETHILTIIFSGIAVSLVALFVLLKFEGLYGKALDENEGRKRTEEALRDSEEKFRTLADNIPNLAWMADASGEIFWFNKRWYDYTGTTPEEMLGWGWLKVHHPDHVKAVEEAWSARIKAGKPHERTSPIRGKDGEYRWFLVRVTPIRDEQGNIRRWFGTNTDITERKRAEESLQESEARLVEAQRIANIGSWEWDIKNDIDKWSEETYRIFRVKPGEFGGNFEAFIERVHPDDRERIRGAVNKAIHDKTSFSYDYRIILPEGGIRYLHNENEIVVDSGGNVIKLRGTVQDITERKSTEEALRKSEEDARHRAEELEKLMDLAPVPIFMSMDPECRVITVNKAANRMFEVDEGENISVGSANGEKINSKRRIFRDGRELLPEELPMQKAAASGADVMFSELDVLLPSGRWRTVLGNASPLLDDNGRVRGSIGMFVDITDRKHAEEELKASKQQVELYLDLMGHDINNMNQVALGYLELARNMPAGAEKTEYLDKSVEVLQRSTKLIENVRKLQKLRDGLFLAKDMDVCSMLMDLQSEYGAVSGKTITFNMNGHEHCIVSANELLHDVFANLVNNAVKHTGDGAEIAVSLDVVEDNGVQFYRVAVEDNGPGIPDDSKEKKFNRMQKGTARGMGLGLYLVRTLVDNYNGRVWAEDRIKGDHTKGARFVVILPAVEN